jgi:hypothetical protein
LPVPFLNDQATMKFTLVTLVLAAFTVANGAPSKSIEDNNKENQPGFLSKVWKNAQDYHGNMGANTVSLVNGKPRIDGKPTKGFWANYWESQQNYYGGLGKAVFEATSTKKGSR